MDKKIILVIYQKMGALNTTIKTDLARKLSKKVKKIFLNG